MGPLMLDLLGYELSQDEHELLEHPMCGGVILFSRNYHDIEQVQHLCQQIRQRAGRQLLIAVDHEGGRVQRFRNGLSRIPAMGSLMTVANQDLAVASEYAQQLGWLMAAEVMALGVDISFAPVLDISGICTVIGDRGFSQHPQEIIRLASGFIRGMNQAGMLATGKHFPGHGGVVDDTHLNVALDKRSQAQIVARDLAIFKTLIVDRLLAAVMPAHVIYPAVDSFSAAGFSTTWLKDILRQQLGFTGVVFSDDLSMQAACSAYGSAVERVQQALEAGCDMTLCCNDRDAVECILDEIPIETQKNLTQRAVKFAPFIANIPYHWQQLINSHQWDAARRVVERFER